MKQRIDNSKASAPAFAHLIDLAAERFGGQVLWCTDDFFAEKENLIKPSKPIFIADKYTDRGKWMDGWESRRKRTPGNDWCIVRLGMPGVVRGVVVDTTHFKGNAPESVSIDACEAPASATGEELASNGKWRPLLAKTRVEPHTENQIAIADSGRCTHLRLNIEVRVKSVRYEENRKGDLVRQHVFALESVQLVSSFQPEEAADDVGGSASGKPSQTDEEAEELGLRIGRTAEIWEAS